MGYNNDDCRFDVDLTEYKKGGHAVDINLAPIKALAPEFKVQSKLPSIGIPEDIKKFVKPLLNNLSHKILFLNLTAGMPARHWDPQNWIELLDLLSQNEDYDILVNTYGMPKDEVSSLKDKFSNIFFFPRKLEQLELVEVIRRSSVVISPDTSVIHMASAFNVPVVNLMNNVEWNIERFAPLSEKQRVLISEEKNSLKGITPDTVYRAFLDLMNQ
jgi:ADP-heptose:LPS heptosyltransferase